MNKKSTNERTRTPVIADAEINGVRDSLLIGLRATGNTIGVLAIEDEDFFNMVENDPKYRTMILEMLKLMFDQSGYDAKCAEMAEKARRKMIAALAASNDVSIMDAFKRPVDMTKIPPWQEINASYVNNLLPAWQGDLAS